MSIRNKILQNKKIIIFQCGYYGRLAYRKLYKKNKILNFFDNFSKQNLLFGIKIIKPQFLDEKYFDYIILVGRDIPILKKQLKKLGYKNSQIKILNNVDVRPSGLEAKKREKLARKLLKKTLSIFKKLNINYVCEYSALLSVIREKKFAAFSDFEISVELKNFRKIFKYFKNKGFIIKYNVPFKYKKVLYKNFYLTTAKKLSKIIEHPRVCFDFYVNTFNGYKKIPVIRFVDKNYFTNTKEISLNGLIMNAPNNLKKHLNNIYGPNWKRTKKFWYN